MIESFANGVPVFCDPTASAALPIAETDFTKIEKPKYEERELLFHSLAYANFNLTELQDGTAWRILNEKTDYYTKSSTKYKTSKQAIKRIWWKTFSTTRLGKSNSSA